MRRIDPFYNRPVYDPDQLSCLDFDGPFDGPPVRSFETEPPRKVTAYSDEPIDIEKFRALFYEFADPAKWPDKMVAACFKRAMFYVPLKTQCDLLDGDDREYARGLLTAHVMILSKQNTASFDNPALANGSGGVEGGSMMTLPGTGIVTSASIGSVSYSRTLPQSADTYEFWLNQTPYGIEFQAFLSNHVPVGIYSQGDDIRMCFRD